MKTLVVYYSKSGNTRRVAEEIARALGGEAEELIEIGAKRTGILGFLFAGRDGMRGRASQIEAPRKRPTDYDVLFIGSPVWGGNVVPAVRSYMSSVDLAAKPIAFFCTAGGSGTEKTLTTMRSLASASRTVGELAVQQAELKSPDALTRRVSAWAREMAAAAGAK
jgi:flavodoxin